mmetsp:Transcript_15332/g.29141  ORF Transcript_15332/g.29141 Transcript_15332/m.29141 type:complete len:189 (+) Transcript_15332:692-1258(+)
MWQRTLVMSSAGKTFSVTGWKIGWCVGPANLVRCVQSVHQFVSFSVSTPMQEAIARSLKIALKPYKGSASYYDYLAKTYKAKRDYLTQCLQEAGLKPSVPEGSFFTVADISKIRLPEKYDSMKGVTHDWAFCLFLAEVLGVVAIPMSPFYAEEDKSLAANLVRFAFCKTDTELKAAEQRLKKLREYTM